MKTPVFGTVLMMLLISLSPAGYGQDVREIIRRIDDKQQTIQTLAAGFVQKRETSLAQNPLFSSGVIRFKRPDRIHFLYSKPEPVEMALDGKNIWIYHPGRWEAEKYSLGKSRRVTQYLDPVTGIFQKTFAQLGEKYNLTYLGSEGEGLYRFRLEPREERVRKFLARVDLWIDKGSGAIVRFEMTEANQDRLTLEFQDLRINPPLTESDLTIQIPPSVRIQEPSTP